MTKNFKKLVIIGLFSLVLFPVNGAVKVQRIPGTIWKECPNGCVDGEGGCNCIVWYAYYKEAGS
jgi:hypothetical protein